MEQQGVVVGSEMLVLNQGMVTVRNTGNKKAMNSRIKGSRNRAGFPALTQIRMEQPVNSLILYFTPL